MPIWFINPRRSRFRKRRGWGAEKISTPSGTKTVRGAWLAGSRARESYWRTPGAKARQTYTYRDAVDRARDAIRTAESKYLSNSRKRKSRRKSRRNTDWRSALADARRKEWQEALADARKAQKNPRRKKRKAKTSGHTKRYNRRFKKSRKGKRKTMSKLYGAAKRAHKRRLAKAKRRRARRSRRNPSRSRVLRGRARAAYGQGISIWAHTARAKRKAKAAAKRKRSKKGGSKAARRRAGKKAAATRARKKAARSRAAKKAARSRKRKHGGKKMARRRKHRKVRKLKALARRKRYGRGVRSLVRARRSIKYSRKHGSGFARRYLKRYRMRTNPMGAIKDMIKGALPVVLGVVGARAVTGGLLRVGPIANLLAKVPRVDPGVVAAAAGAGAVYALTKFVPPLRKYAAPAMVGAGVNLLLQAISVYAPDSIKGYIGAGEYASVSDYQSDVGEYEEVSNYEEVGAYQDAAGWAEGLARGVGRHSALKQLPSASVVDEVDEFSESDFQEGVFANTGWGN